jgi:hypothetical protein
MARVIALLLLLTFLVSSCSLAKENISVPIGVEYLATDQNYLYMVGQKEAYRWRWDAKERPEKMSFPAGALIWANGPTALVHPKRDEEVGPRFLVRVKNQQVEPIAGPVPQFFFSGPGVRAHEWQRNLALAFMEEDYVITSNTDNPAYILAMVVPDTGEVCTHLICKNRGMNDREIGGIALSPDCALAAVAGRIKGPAWIAVMDVKTGKIVAENISSSLFRFTGCCFSPDSKLLYAGGDCGYAYCFDVQTGKQMVSYLTGSSGKDGPDITALAASPDGKFLAAGTGAAGIIYLWDARSGKLMRKIFTCDNTTMGLVFSSDSKYLASKGVSGRKVRLWQME